jgi:Ca2+-transporting ATPase
MSATAEHDGEAGPAEEWHTVAPDAVLTALDTATDGLSASAVDRRLEGTGPNDITTSGGRHPVGIFLEQFSSALVWILLLAAGVSFAIGHRVDAVLIAAILLANGVFGFVQEYRAESTLDALRDLAAPSVTVRRAGEETECAASALVPGDIVLLSQGDVVPADCRLLETSSLEVDEAPLTGESVPVAKAVPAVPGDTPLAERTSMLYRGTNVTRGSAVAVVVATGMDTEMGAIATALLDAEDARTPLQRDLDQLGRRLGIAVVALAAVVVALLLANGTNTTDAALTAISLAVAAIPEGLPAVVTLTLALGVRRMADENALVRRLAAVEGLGAVDVICTDKTGTLTEGEMRAQQVWIPDDVLTLEAGTDDDRVTELLELAALCNDATADEGDPTERGLVHAAEAHGIDVAALRERQPRTDERPFSAERKRMATVHDDRVAVKGAPQVVLERSTHVLTADGPEPLDDPMRARIEERIDGLAADALRVLAVATRAGTDGDIETDLTLVGLVGLLDPPRPEVPDAIRESLAAGIGVKMITGDNARTAAAIASQIGIESAVLTGSEIAAMDDATLRERVTDVDVFARAEPTHKVRVLQALQANGLAVAMTGDGINDAPALKNADIGIAMGVRGTDVAKQASDMILLDDNFATIRTAIRRGRTIFDNVWKFVCYLLSANAAEVLLVVIASLWGYLILPAVQLLWINLLTDGLPALALGSDPGGDVMRRGPRDRNAGVIDRPMLVFIGGAAVAVTAIMLGLMVHTLDGAPRVTPYAMTMVFTGFVCFEFVKLYAVRWLKGTPLTSNPWLAAAVAGSLVMQLAVLYTPLRGYFGTVPLAVADWAIIGGALLVGAPAMLTVGWVVRRFVAADAA